ncbi:MAG: glycosyltransferase family 2 protein [Kiloniellales bacterium]
MSETQMIKQEEASEAGVQASAVCCDASVVICTVNRPTLLARAVDSVVAQENQLGLDFEIVVVDNSVDGRSRKAVQDLAHKSAVPIRYVSERRMSFAYARNAGVRAARGELIAFLDDDEEASAGWLDSLAETLRRFDADVVFGPILPRFEGGKPPSWDPDGRHHVRRLDVPTGTEISARSTGNVLMKRASCVLDEAPFAQELGITGGEDVDFFMRLQRLGRKLVWAGDAVVTELQPAETLTLGYRSYRIFCGNQSYVKTSARNSSKPFKTKLRLMAAGAVQVVVFFLPWLASYLAPTGPLIAARLKFCSGLGKLLWMIPSRLYARRYG